MRGHLAGFLVFGVSWLSGCGTSDDEVEPAHPLSVVHPRDDSLRFNHLQAKSTHNSYHLETPGNEAVAWAYSHAPLEEQLGAQGVRHVELDLRKSTDGTFLEVYHVGLLDEETTCRRFADCLTAIKTWSDANPGHHPIVIQLEVKQPFGEVSAPDDLALIEKEILDVWPLDGVITPDDVQGDAASLGEAVASHGWPLLAELRGRTIFAFDDSGSWKAAYSEGGTTLDGRLIFVDSEPGEPLAAYTVINDPVGGADRISAALAANLVVRTRADSDTEEARTGDTTRRDAALASGAHFITTDFPAPVAGASYWVDIPGGSPSRCNPVTAPAECSSSDIEDPELIQGR